VILIKNKLRLLGFVFAFLFFTTLLIGFLNGSRPIPGATKYSDNHFNTNDVEIKANIKYKFVCDFADGAFFIDNMFYRYNLPEVFSVYSDVNCVWQFRHLDKAMDHFSYFWSRDFILYENKLTDFVIHIQSSKLIFTYYNSKDFEKELKNNFQKPVHKKNKRKVK